MGRKGAGWILKALQRAILVPPLFLSVFLCLWTISAVLPFSSLVRVCPAPPGSSYASRADQRGHCLYRRVRSSRQLSPGAAELRHHTNINHIKNRNVNDDHINGGRMPSDQQDLHLHRLPLKLDVSQEVINARTPAKPVMNINHARRIANGLNDDHHDQANSLEGSSGGHAGDQLYQEVGPNSVNTPQEASHQYDQLPAPPSSNSITHDQKASTDQKVAAEQEVLRLMENLRTSASFYNQSFLLESGVTVTGRPNPSCDAKKVYIYDLPPKFNSDLLARCDRIIPWLSMCDYFSNSGMGIPLDQVTSANRQTDHQLMGSGQIPESSEQVLVPSPHWYRTHQYSLEILFHERLKQYPCLVGSPEEADLFYVPYYGGLDVLRWHFVKNASLAEKDELGLELVGWLREQAPWKKSKGVDHVLVLGKISWDFRRSEKGQWGNTLLLQPEMQDMTKLMIERQPWQPHDVGVPHPTFFHPRSDRDIRMWQGRIDGAKRRYLVSFAGQSRPQQPESIRSHLISQCLSNPTSCFFLPCNGSICMQPNTTMNLFMHSEFCLQPPGDSPTRRSIFDSLIAGCIPVLFCPYSAYYQYPWHLPADPASYSVYIPQEDVRQGKANVVEELQKIPRTVRQEMRIRIIYEIMPGLVYAKPGSRLRELEDAFVISLRSLFSRVATRVMDSRTQNNLTAVA